MSAGSTTSRRAGTASPRTAKACAAAKARSRKRFGQEVSLKRRDGGVSEEFGAGIREGSSGSTRCGSLGSAVHADEGGNSIINIEDSP